jgi:hypothetical protein
MKANPQDWTIVIVGSWNTKIFNPRWISEKLFSNPEQQVQVLIPVVPGFPTVLQADGIEIVPSEDSLTFRATSADTSTVLGIEDKAVAALRVLEHTPVRAIGVNFGFIEDNVPDSFTKLLVFWDEERLSAKELTPVQRQVSRTLQMPTGVLNLLLTRSRQELKLGFNFHLDLDYPHRLENALQAVEFIEGKVPIYLQNALSLLRDVYDISLEEQGVTA